MNSFVCLWATYARAHIVRCTTLHHRLKWPVSWAILYLFTSFSLSLSFSSCPNNHRNLECSCKFFYIYHICIYHTQQAYFFGSWKVLCCRNPIKVLSISLLYQKSCYSSEFQVKMTKNRAMSVILVPINNVQFSILVKKHMILW